MYSYVYRLLFESIKNIKNHNISGLNLFLLSHHPLVFLSQLASIKSFKNIKFTSLLVVYCQPLSLEINMQLHALR